MLILLKGEIQLTDNEKRIVLLIGFLIAIALFLNALTGRYQYWSGQNNIHGEDYLPSILDTWTGKTQSMQGYGYSTQKK